MKWWGVISTFIITKAWIIPLHALTTNTTQGHKSMTFSSKRDLLAQLKEAEENLIELCIRNKIEAKGTKEQDELTEALDQTRQMLLKATGSISN